MLALYSKTAISLHINILPNLYQVSVLFLRWRQLHGSPVQLACTAAHRGQTVADVGSHGSAPRLEEGTLVGRFGLTYLWNKQISFKSVISPRRIKMFF